MLWALLADFRSWGAVRTVSALDPRFENRIPGLDRDTLPADEVAPADPEDPERTFLSLLDRCDAALVIAPETGGILSGLSAQVERAGRPLLGSASSAVEQAGNKDVCGRILAAAGLPAPETRICRIDSVIEAIGDWGYPLVLKPLDGIGSEGVYLIAGRSDIAKAVSGIRRVTPRDTVLLQPFVEGVHASVSLLAASGRCFPMSLNRQLIRPGMPFEYRGSVVPYACERSREALEAACAAAGLIEGLRGYVGVDLVLTADSVRLIEINPRLTTSYIGLRQVAGVNPAGAICDASIRGVLPDRFPLGGPVAVYKDNPASWRLGRPNLP